MGFLNQTGQKYTSHNILGSETPVEKTSQDNLDRVQDLKRKLTYDKARKLTPKKDKKDPIAKNHAYNYFHLKVLSTFMPKTVKCQSCKQN